jgi:redox-sensitive bicupin YhaK (pirin superfamily)
MSPQFSPVVAAHQRALPGFTSLLYVDLQELGVAASPVAVLDDFRVTGMPVSPHPHAGFAAATYLLEDSPGGLRSRASSGADLFVGPGGIVWTQAGSGIMHEEVPAVHGRELHGLQIFVNLSSRDKLAAPQVLSLAPDEVPEWRSGAGDRVRVVVGTFEDITSPLIPAEPFTLLDVTLSQDISIDLQAGYNAVAYVLSGQAQMSSEHDQVQVDASLAAAALHSTGGQVRFTAVGPRSSYNSPATRSASPSSPKAPSS